MVLLEGASPCDCHVIDDTPCFQTILILHSNTCDCSVLDSFLTSFLSPLCTSTDTHLTPMVVSSSTLSAHKNFNLDFVRMVLLDEGAIPCECHVIDDTPCFQTILILHSNTSDCSVTDSLFTSFLSPLCTSTHTHLTLVVVSSSTLSAHKNFNLDSVRMVLLDEGASPCECHVIDDTPRFLTIVILNTSISDCSVADSFLTSSLPLLHTSTHIHLTPATCGFFFIHTECSLHPQGLQPGLC